MEAAGCFLTPELEARFWRMLKKRAVRFPGTFPLCSVMRIMIMRAGLLLCWNTVGGGQLFTGAGFFTEKGKLMDGEYYDLGPGFRREDLERCGVRNTVVERSCLIFPGMSLFSGLRSPGNGYFYLKDGGDFCEDPFQEELHLLVSGKDASALITGCAHCGIARIVEKANSLFPEFPVREVYGGLHLSRLPDEQIRETGKRLMELGIKKAGLCHCSGGRLPDFFPGGPFFPVSAGERVELLS